MCLNKGYSMGYYMLRTTSLNLNPLSPKPLSLPSSRFGMKETSYSSSRIEAIWTLIIRIAYRIMLPQHTPFSSEI